jgi:topoisomerase-4 subunit B
VQLTIEPGDNTYKVMDMLLGKKTIQARKSWLEKNGDLAQT